MESDGEARHYDTHHTHKFDEDVERRAGCVLERITDCISDYRCVVTFGVLATEMSLFNIFLGIVPCTA